MSHMLQGVYLGVLGYLQVRLERLSINAASRASHPGKARLSRPALRALSPILFPSLTNPWRLTRWLLGPSMAEVFWIKNILIHGDSNPAVVMSTEPLLVAAYCDDMDCIAMLRFPREYVEKYHLEVGAPLISILNGIAGSERAADLTEGPLSNHRLTNFQPFLADFLSEDREWLATRKGHFANELWDRTWDMGWHYLERNGPVSRDGRPPYSSIPAAIPARRLHRPGRPTHLSRIDSPEIAQHYEPSGYVDPGTFFPLALVSLFASLLVSGVLYAAYRNGLYFVMLVPIVLAFAIQAVVHLAVTQGKCRSPVLGMSLGILAGLVAYLGYYQIDMVAQHGPQAMFRFDELPRFIALRKNTELLGQHLQPVPNARPDPGQIAFNWLFFVVELGAFVFVAGGTGLARSRRAFCETCREWQTQELVFFPSGMGKTVVEAALDGDLSDLVGRGSPSIAHGASGAALALEHCPYGEHSHDCPVHLSVKEVKTVAQSPSGVFDYALGWMLLRRRVLAPTELAPFLSFFPNLKARLAAQAGRPSLSRRAAPLSNEVWIEPIRSQDANKILSRTHWRIATSLGLAWVYLSMVILAAGFAGYFIFGYELAPPLGLVLAGLAHLSARGNVGSISTWYFRRVARRQITLRPDAIVSPDEPDAVFVKVVPRHNWAKMVLEESSDIGFLVVDSTRGEIRFEGDVERWCIPRQALLSCDLQQVCFVEDEYFAHWMVVIQARDASGSWERPIDLPLVPRLRRSGAETLRGRILAFLEKHG